MVAQYVNSQNVQPPEDNNHPLVSAHQARRWGPYLMQQLKQGQPLRKWRSRQEEKSNASVYDNGLALLNDLYRDT